MSLRVVGYVIVSTDGMLADVAGNQPSSLMIAGDQRFFEQGLEQADLIVHGRRSHEGQKNSGERRRLVATRSIDSLAPHPTYPRATNWNPAGMSFEEACRAIGVGSGTVAVIGGPILFAHFLPRYDSFYLSEVPGLQLAGGEPAFAGFPGLLPPAILANHGLMPADKQLLDPPTGTTVTHWRRGPAKISL